MMLILGSSAWFRPAPQDLELRWCTHLRQNNLQFCKYIKSYKMNIWESITIVLDYMHTRETFCYQRYYTYMQIYRYQYISISKRLVFPLVKKKFKGMFTKRKKNLSKHLHIFPLLTRTLQPFAKQSLWAAKSSASRGGTPPPPSSHICELLQTPAPNSNHIEGGRGWGAYLAKSHKNY